MGPLSKTFGQGADAAIALALICAGLWECGLGWAQLAGLTPSLHSLYPATGTFYNPGPYCGFLAVVMPPALYVVMTRRRGLLYVAALAYVVVATAIMPVLMGRTGWVAAAVGCMLAAAGCGRLRHPGRRAMAAAAVAAVAAGVFLICLKPASALGRLFLWRTGVAAALGHPLTGVGWSRVAGALGDAQEAYFHACPDSVFAAVAGSPDYAFNEFIQIAIAFGLPAMLAFAAAMAAAGVTAWRAGAYGIAGGVAAMAVVCLSSYPLQFAEFIAAGGLLAAGAIVCNERLRVAVRVAACMAVAALTVAACMYDVPQTDSARRLFDRGKALREAGLYRESTDLLLRGTEVSSDPMFLNLIGRNCHDTGQYELAAHYYRRAADRLPGRLYPYYLLGRLYADPAVSDTARFMEVYARAEAMEPKVMSPAIKQIRRELRELRDRLDNAGD